MNWKTVAVISLSLLILLLALVLGRPAVREALLARPPDEHTVVTQIQSLKQLVTVRYRIQRIVGMTEPKTPFGSESILLMVEGQVLAGVDLGEVGPGNITLRDRHNAAIRLPAPRVFDTFLDEKQTRVWDRQITWWTPWVPPDPDLEHKARLKALDEVRTAALEMGIYDQAERNARTAIRDVLNAFQLKATFDKPSGS